MRDASVRSRPTSVIRAALQHDFNEQSVAGFAYADLSAGGPVYFVPGSPNTTETVAIPIEVSSIPRHWNVSWREAGRCLNSGSSPGQTHAQAKASFF